MCMDKHERNHVPMDASRMATRGGMIRALITNAEQMRETVRLQGDHGRDKCQVFQPIQVFGTHTSTSTKLTALPKERHENQGHLETRGLL
jgi:hypothetical protein